MKTLNHVLPWALLLTALVLLGLSWRANSILKAENDGLKAALEAKQAAGN